MKSKSLYSPWARLLGTSTIVVLGLVTIIGSGGGGGGGGTTPPPPVTFSLTATTGGTGTGTVSSSPAGIDCGTDCSEDYDENTVVTLTPSPAADSVFAGWSGACTGSGSCSVTMDAAKSVTATFDLQQYTLNVTLAGTGTGTVTSSPAGIDCGTDCSEDYTVNTLVTLTPSPATDSLFAGWSGACTGTGSCSVTLDAARSVAATFDLLQFSLTVTQSGTGSGTVVSTPSGINCSSVSCVASFPINTQVMLSSAPGAGSLFEGYSGDCASIASTCAVTITEDKTVSSTFNLTVASDSGNQLGLDGSADVAVHELAANPPASSLDLTTFSIETWVYPLANQDMIIVADSAYYLMIKARTVSLPLRAEFSVMTTTGLPAFISFAGTSQPLQLNQWNHIVGIANNFSHEIVLAVNGEFTTPQSVATNIDTSFNQTFSIGNSYPASLGDFPFIGRIDEVRLTAGTRYFTDFTPSSLLDADGGTAGLWHFDEAASETSFADSSGNANTLGGSGGAAIVAGNRADQAIANSLFYSLDKITLGQTAGPMVVIDLDKDGNNDLAIAGVFSVASENIAVLLGNGDGTFGAANYYSTGVTGAHADIKAYDFDNNGNLDIVVANGSNNSISVLMGAGDGSFGTATTYAMSGDARSITAGNFNADEFPDLAVANLSDGVSIFLGTGTGAFDAATNYTAGTDPYAVTTGLFNNDSNLDLAVVNNGDDTVSILHGTGTGTFGAATDYAVGDQPFAIEAKDLNGDSRPDLVTANFASGNVSVLLANVSGSFDTATHFPVGFGGPAYLTINDMNGDTEQDIAVASGGGNAEFSILLGDGSGSFGDPISYLTEGNPLSLGTGDVNGDSIADLLMGNNGTDINIYFRR
jgi:hypothetical protein